MATVLGAWRMPSRSPVFKGRCLGSQTVQRLRVEKEWQVSTHGRVCNTRGMISYGSLKSSGYRVANISCTQFFVHRLVVFTFRGPPPADDTWRVHHRDGNPSNNHLDNLEYVTQSQNLKESYAKPRRTGGPQQSLPVMWRPVGSHSWTISPSMTQAAEQLGMSIDTISRGCRHGKPAKGIEIQLADRGEAAALDGEEWREMLDPMSGSKVAGRFVSSLGRIRSKTNIISRGCQTKQGYNVTSLSLGFSRRTEMIHRLVAFAFLGPSASQQDQVNHKDLDKGNNSVVNLEYVTAAENIAHRYANGKARTRSDGKPVESRLRGSREGWRWHPSINGASNALQVSGGSIFHCLAGRRQHTGGFEFRLAKMPQIRQLAGEEWRRVDGAIVDALLQERTSREKK